MANREVAVAAQTSEGVQVQPTAVEIALSKAMARVNQMKHVDVKTFIMDYFFPLLGKVAKEQGDQGERLDDVEARVAQLEGSALIETFEDARDLILGLAGLLDEVMVASGFYVVVQGKGLRATDTIPQAMREKYEEFQEDAKEVILDIGETILELKVDEPDDGGDPDADPPEDGEPDDVDEKVASEQANAAIAEAIATTAATAVAKTEAKTDAKEEGTNGTP